MFKLVDARRIHRIEFMQKAMVFYLFPQKLESKKQMWNENNRKSPVTVTETQS